MRVSQIIYKQPGEAGPDDAPPRDAAAEARAAREALVAEQMAALAEMRRMGMALAAAAHEVELLQLRAQARALADAEAAAQARDADPDADAGAPAPLPPALSGRGFSGRDYDRITRSVRLTIALEQRLMAEATAAAATPARSPTASVPIDPQMDPAQLAKVRARMALLAARAGAVVTVVKASLVAAGRPREVVEALSREITEQLVDHERFQVFNHPISVTIARLCEALDATPDWTLWAAEPWAIEEAEKQMPGSPYADAGPWKPAWTRGGPPPEGSP